MGGRDWLVTLSLGASVLAALLCAVLIAGGYRSEAYATAGALLVLALGQVMMFAAMRSRSAARDADAGKQERTVRTMTRDVDDHARRIAELEEKLNRQSIVKPEQVVSEMQSLRDSVQDIKQRLAEPAAALDAKPKSASEQLELLLEPVIELATDTTAHYRAQLHMVNGTVGEVAHAELMAKAEKGGMRAALDLHMFKKVIPVLRRLRAKNQGRCVFVPLGTSTLVSQRDLDAIVGQLEAASDVAGGIVFEFAHAQLASLTPDGIEGLARLARLGATMALSHVTIAGLDLASLQQLGVRYLDVEGGAMDHGFGIAPSWFEFAQFARAMKFQILAGGVVTGTHAAAAARIARFGHGPYYAPPRRLRANAGSEAVYDRPQAA